MGTVITSDSISFVASTKTIADANNGFGAVAAGNIITIDNSKLNDGSYKVVTAAAGSLVVSSSLIDEALDAEITTTLIIADAYDEIEGGWEVILKNNLTLVSDANIGRGDGTKLNTDDQPKILLYPGAASIPRKEYRYSVLEYETRASIIIYYAGQEKDGWRNLTLVRDEIVKWVDAHPTIDDMSGVLQVRYDTDGDPDEIYDSNDGGQTFTGPYGIVQDLRIFTTRRIDRQNIGEFS